MKKAQAAMEFLMTYGWAILVVLAAIGALAYFGVLSPSKLLPSKCTLSPGFNFGDCKASVSGFQATVYNGLGVDATNVTVVINTTAGSDVSCQEEQPAAGPIALLGNGATTTSLTFCAAAFATATEGQRFDADVSIYYVKSGETLSHTVTGKVQIKVEK
jgi:hypothetical protein